MNQILNQNNQLNYNHKLYKDKKLNNFQIKEKYKK